MNVYFGLGSNLGDRLKNLRDALACLRTLGDITACSDVYETEAWGGVPQPDYLNACVKASMPQCTPPYVLADVKRFELELGRVTSVRWGARKIDIDILLIDDAVYRSDTLNVPHISIPDRLFVLVPLGEIVPEGWRHPVNGKTIREMTAGLEGEAWPVRVTGL